MPDFGIAALQSSTVTMHVDRDYAYIYGRRSRLAARNHAPDNCTGRQGAQRGSAAGIAMPPTIASMPAVIPSPMMPAPIPNVLDVRHAWLGQGLNDHGGRGGWLGKGQHCSAENAQGWRVRLLT